MRGVAGTHNRTVERLLDAGVSMVRIEAVFQRAATSSRPGAYITRSVRNAEVDAWKAAMRETATEKSIRMAPEYDLWSARWLRAMAEWDRLACVVADEARPVFRASVVNALALARQHVFGHTIEDVCGTGPQDTREYNRVLQNVYRATQKVLARASFTLRWAIAGPESDSERQERWRVYVLFRNNSGGLRTNVAQLDCARS
jgi:hypothetical protein